MQHRYRRVLAAIDVDRRGDAVARHAWGLARDHGASFALAHVVDYGRGFDGDHVPFLTPSEMEAKLEAVVRQRLNGLAIRLAAPASTLIGFGDAATVLPRLALGWQPDLVVVGTQAPHGLRQGQRLQADGAYGVLDCEVLILPRPEARGWLGTLLRKWGAGEVLPF